MASAQTREIKAGSAEGTSTLAPPAPRLVRLRIAGLALLCGLATTNDWCFVLIPVGLASWVADWLVSKATRSPLPRALLGVAVGVAGGALVRLDPD